MILFASRDMNRQNYLIYFDCVIKGVLWIFLSYHVYWTLWRKIICENLQFLKIYEIIQLSSQKKIFCVCNRKSSSTLLRITMNYRNDSNYIYNYESLINYQLTLVIRSAYTIYTDCLFYLFYWGQRFKHNYLN